MQQAKKETQPFFYFDGVWACQRMRDGGSGRVLAVDGRANSEQTPGQSRRYMDVRSIGSGDPPESWEDAALLEYVAQYFYILIL